MILKTDRSISAVAKDIMASVVLPAMKHVDILGTTMNTGTLSKMISKSIVHIANNWRVEGLASETFAIRSVIFSISFQIQAD